MGVWGFGGLGVLGVWGFWGLGFRVKSAQGHRRAKKKRKKKRKKEKEKNSSTKNRCQNRPFFRGEAGFRSKGRFCQTCYEGPMRSADAKSAERSRWINLLADLLWHAHTPMGRFLRENRSTPSYWEGAGELVLCVHVYAVFRSSSHGLRWLTE